MTDVDFAGTFQHLHSILAPYASRLVVVRDTPEHYALDTAHVEPDGKPLPFGAARIGKHHVSYHLMPVSVWPALLDTTPTKLKRRLQGRSCFNFTHPDPELMRELAALTERGFDRYREHQYVP